MVQKKPPKSSLDIKFFLTLLRYPSISNLFLSISNQNHYFRRHWHNYVECHHLVQEALNLTKHYNLELVNWRKRCVMITMESHLENLSLIIIIFSHESFPKVQKSIFRILHHSNNIQEKYI